MFKIIKNFNWIILSSFLCIFMGIVTFLTFINEGFVPLTDKNLQSLLIIDLFLLLVFFTLIFKNFYRFYYARNKNKKGYQSNLNYISVFSLFTVIPSLIVAIFSLFIFNFGIQNYFDKQITNAVNNSYDVAKNYLEESKENVLSDVILMSVGLNRASGFYYSNRNRFKNIMKSLSFSSEEKKMLKNNLIILSGDYNNEFPIKNGELNEINLFNNRKFYNESKKQTSVINLKKFKNRGSFIIDHVLSTNKNTNMRVIKTNNEWYSDHYPLLGFIK